MVAHLTEIEKAQVDRCTRRNEGTVTEAWEAVNRRRARPVHFGPRMAPRRLVHAIAQTLPKRK